MNKASISRPKHRKRGGTQTAMTTSLFLMTLPALIWLFLFRYLPMPGMILAFKDFRITAGQGFIGNLITSSWNNFANFRSLFVGSATGTIIRNTLVYNFAFIVLGAFFAVVLAICLNEIRQKKLAKIYQTLSILPFFMSWVVVSYLLYAILSPSNGLLNQIIQALGGEGVRWYSESERWPLILILVSLWKSVGYNSIIYLAALTAINPTFYDAAVVDGASKWQQIRHISVPLIAPIILVLMILAFGRIFFADFGLFYQVPRNTGALYPATNVIDTYVFRALFVRGDLGLGAAIGFLQSLIGFMLVVGANSLVRRIDKSKSLF
ncbi:MAG: ABC transporter permease [Salinispira sp.]